MTQRPRSLLRRLHDFFLPHRGNGYKPHFFRTASVTTVVLLVMVLEGAYLAQIHIVFPKTNFLASVLPGALVALTNQDRATADAPAVVESPTLDQAATLAAEDMATKGYFAHVSPAGVTPWDWLNKVGYEYTYAGENLAVNFTDSSAVENAWMASPSHHANIVKPQYTQVGIGVADGMYQGSQVTFVVQFFATPAGATPAPAAASEVAFGGSTETTTVVPTPSPKPAPKPVILPVPKGSEVPTTTEVLASSTTPPASASVPSTIRAAKPSLLARALAAPTRMMVLILSVLALLVLALLIVAIVVKLQVQYLEVIGGGLVLLMILIGLIVFNIVNVGKVEVPANPQDSSVVS